LNLVTSASKKLNFYYDNGEENDSHLHSYVWVSPAKNAPHSRSPPGLPRPPNQGWLKGEVSPPLTSVWLIWCFFTLPFFAIKNKKMYYLSADSKPVKQKVNGTMILPPFSIPWPHPLPRACLGQSSSGPYGLSCPLDHPLLVQHRPSDPTLALARARRPSDCHHRTAGLSRHHCGPLNFRLAHPDLLLLSTGLSNLNASNWSNSLFPFPTPLHRHILQSPGGCRLHTIPLLSLRTPTRTRHHPLNYLKSLSIDYFVCTLSLTTNLVFIELSFSKFSSSHISVWLVCKGMF
jgi:hypothetical protein